MSGISKLDLVRLDASDILDRFSHLVRELSLDDEFNEEQDMYACSFRVIGLDGYRILKNCCSFYSTSLESLKEKVNKLGEATANDSSIISIRLKDINHRCGNTNYYEILIKINYQ